MKRHRLKISNWVDGKLEHYETEHDSFEEALLIAANYIGLIKIYNELDQLIHVENRILNEEKKEREEDDCYA